MNNENENTEELLDRILFGQSSRDELAAMEPTDDHDIFLKDLGLHRCAAALIQRQSVIKQVQTAQEIYFKKYKGQQYENAEPFKRTRKLTRFVIPAAAALVIACIITVLYWFNWGTAERLFTERYQPYHLNVPRADSSATSVISEQYGQHHLREIIARQQKTPAVTVRDKMVTASAYMQLQHFGEAATLFGGLLLQNQRTGSDLYQDEAEYYLALCCLRQKQYDRAYALFHKIYADSEHTYHQEVNWWFLTRVRLLK